MGAFKSNGRQLEPITIRLNQYSVQDMMPSIVFAQASAELGMSAQDRDVGEQKADKHRGMFCEDWFIRTNPLGFVRNPSEDRLAPELIQSNEFCKVRNTLWDFKSVLKTCALIPEFNLYIPVQNYQKDLRLRPPLAGYVGAVLQFPVPTRERRAYTIAIFEQDRFELLQDCMIHVVGWITVGAFTRAMHECKKGQDLNRGDGPVVIAEKDNVGIYIQELTPFKIGRGTPWPYRM